MFLFGCFVYDFGFWIKRVLILFFFEVILFIFILFIVMLFGLGEFNIILLYVIEVLRDIDMYLIICLLLFVLVSKLLDVFADVLVVYVKLVLLVLFFNVLSMFLVMFLVIIFWFCEYKLGVEVFFLEEFSFCKKVRKFFVFIIIVGCLLCFVDILFIILFFLLFIMMFLVFEVLNVLIFFWIVFLIIFFINLENNLLLVLFKVKDFGLLFLLIFELLLFIFVCILFCVKLLVSVILILFSVFVLCIILILVLCVLFVILIRIVFLVIVLFGWILLELLVWLVLIIKGEVFVFVEFFLEFCNDCSEVDFFGRGIGFGRIFFGEILILIFIFKDAGVMLGECWEVVIGFLGEGKGEILSCWLFFLFFVLLLGCVVLKENLFLFFRRGFNVEFRFIGEILVEIFLYV